MLARKLTSPARRSIHTTAQTIYSPTPTFLETYLTSNRPHGTSSSLYLLSTSISPSTLSPLLKTIQSYLPNSVGSFSLPPSPDSESSLSILTISNTKSRTFRSGLTGRPAVEVGRWQRPKGESLGDTKGREEGGIEDVWGKEGWAGVWKEGEGLERIDELEGFKAKSIICLSDGKPRPVLSSLDAMFPHAVKTGLVSAPTPFLTGRPYTLMHNDNVYSDGSVGIAIEGALEGVEVDFGLQPLTDIFVIAGAQGNMLLRIEGANPNPTQTLMAAINLRNAGNLASKDEEFFLSLPDTGRIVKILSGDPSRGAMSLDMEDPLLTGQRVQFMYRREGAALPDVGDGGVGFSALKRSDEVDDEGVVWKPRAVKGFWGFSEGGFVHSARGGSSICTVPGAKTYWRI